MRWLPRILVPCSGDEATAVPWSLSVIFDYERASPLFPDTSGGDLWKREEEASSSGALMKEAAERYI